MPPAINPFTPSGKFNVHHKVKSTGFSRSALATSFAGRGGAQQWVLGMTLRNKANYLGVPERP